MYRIYAEYEGVATRTARRYKDLVKAIEAAKKVATDVVYVRQLLPTGQERLVDVVMGGKSATG